MRNPLQGAVRVDGPLVVLVVLALAVRVAAVAIDGPTYVPLNDAADYDRHARSIASGEGYPDALPEVAPSGPSGFRPPAYPFLLGGVHALSGDSAQAGRYANAVLGAIAVLLIYLVARALWSRRVALVAAALAAVYPPLAFLSLELYSEPLFIDLMLAAVLAAIAYRRDPRTRWALAAGALAGLAALTRANALLIIPIIAWALWLPPRRRLEALAAPLAAVLAAAALFAPWALRNWVVFDSFVPVTTSTGVGFAGVYNPDARADERFHALWRLPVATETYRGLYSIPQLREVEIDRELRSGAREFALDHPGYVAEVAFWSGLRMLNLAESGTATPAGLYQGRGFGLEVTPAEPIAFYLIVPLAALGVIALVRRPVLREQAWIWLVPVALVVPALLALGLPRYRAPAEPFLLMLAALGAVAIWDRIAARGAVQPPVDGRSA